MTQPVVKPPWYQQIRWRLTFGYGFSLLVTLELLELVILVVLVGNAYLENPEIDPARLFVTRLQSILYNDLRVLPFFFIIGHLLSGHFSRRIVRLQTAVTAWSNGDFTYEVWDDAPDEIGILTRQLVSASSQLEQFVESEQELAAARERDRIARDLHDSVKQQVFATQMELNAARNLLATDPAAAGEFLTHAIDLTRQSQQELTSLIDRLPPAGLAHRTLGAVLTEYVDGARNLPLDVRLHLEGDRDLPIEVEEALYRVTQGALSNIEKHSQATSLTLDLETLEDHVYLRIADNGVGFDAYEPSLHEFGLDSMRTRMLQIGGTLTVTSEPGKGAIITAEAPLFNKP